MQRWTQYSKRLSPRVLSLILLIGMPLLVAAQPASVSDDNLAKAIDETLA